jgi:hypothetical protein
MNKLPVLPSASSLDDANICPARCVLHQDGKITDAADRGTHCHTYLELVGLGHPRGVALSAIPREYRDWCAAIDTDSLFAGLKDIRLEVPLAIDIVNRSARIMPKTGHRGYGDRQPNEFVGTVDVWARSNGCVLVRDYKTGRDLGDPQFKLQLGFAAVAIHLMTGVTDVDIEYTYVYEDSTFEHVGAHLDVFQIMDTLDALTRLRDRIHHQYTMMIESQPMGFVTGDHCRFCPAYRNCPTKVGLLSTLTGKRVVELDDDNVGWAWTQFVEMRNAVDRLKPLFNEYAVDGGGFATHDGKTVKLISSSKPTLSGPKLAKLARGLGASESDISACMNHNEFSYLKEYVNK